MISHISGKIRSTRVSSVIIDANSLCYEVFIPPVIMKSLDKVKSPDGTITLVTFHYYQMDPSRAVPVLIGFLNEVEKEFFEQFIKVSGVGPKLSLIHI